MKSLFKRANLLFLFGGFALMANAQENNPDETIKSNQPVVESRKFEHQFGFNATELLQTIFGISGFSAQSPYQVNYKFLKLTNGNCFLSSYGLRAGYGHLKNESKIIQNTNNFINTTNINQSNIRVGIEAQKKLNDKWLVFAGIDYTYLKNYQEFKSENNNNPPNKFVNINSNDLKSNGIGPVFGIQFNVNKHIVLNTELSFYLTKGKSINSQENIFNGLSNKQSSETELKTSNIIIPAFINFNIRF